jgi:hypothetical protein
MYTRYPIRRSSDDYVSGAGAAHLVGPIDSAIDHKVGLPIGSPVAARRRWSWSITWQGLYDQRRRLTTLGPTSPRGVRASHNRTGHGRHGRPDKETGSRPANSRRFSKKRGRREAQTTHSPVQTERARGTPISDSHARPLDETAGRADDPRTLWRSVRTTADVHQGGE